MAQEPGCTDLYQKRGKADPPEIAPTQCFTQIGLSVIGAIQSGLLSNQSCGFSVEEEYQQGHGKHCADETKADIGNPEIKCVYKSGGKKRERSFPHTFRYPPA